MSESIFRKEALACQHERLWGEVIISQPTSCLVLTALIAFATAIAFVYLISSEYTRRQNVIGFLVPTKGLVAVFTPQAGLLSELYASEGDFVEQGSDLFKVQIDQKTASGDYISDEILQQFNEQKSRLISAIHLEDESLASLLARQNLTAEKIELELTSLAAQIETKTALNQIELNSVARARELINKGVIAQSDMDTVEKNYLDMKQQLSSLRATLQEKKFELKETAVIRSSYSTDSRKKISELENRISEIDGQIATAEAEQTNIIRAPLSGTITTLTPSLGQKIDGSVPVATIIPADSQLEAHLYVPTSAIGFIQEGQHINLRYEAFPYQRFGLFTASVRQVTNSVLSQNEVPELLPVKEPVYRIMATLGRQTVTAYGRNIMLKPGMLFTADIELDKRSLFEWLLAPLYSLKGKL